MLTKCDTCLGPSIVRTTSKAYILRGNKHIDIWYSQDRASNLRVVMFVNFTLFEGLKSLCQFCIQIQFVVHNMVSTWLYHSPKQYLLLALRVIIRRSWWYYNILTVDIKTVSHHPHAIYQIPQLFWWVNRTGTCRHLSIHNIHPHIVSGAPVPNMDQ